MAKKNPYTEEHLDLIIESMRGGASITEVAANIGIARKTLYEWVKKFPEFSDTIKRGEALSEAWWMNEGRTNLQNNKFNSALWYMNMKNRFGWRDKPKDEGDASDVLADALHKLIGKLPG